MTSDDLPEQGRLFGLQNVLFPDDESPAPRELYLFSESPDLTSSEDGVYHLSSSSKVDFGSYFNLFNAAKWREACALDNLEIEISGKGQIILEVLGRHANGQKDTVRVKAITLEADKPELVDLSECLASDAPGLIYLSVFAPDGPAHLQNIRFVTRSAVAAKLPKIAICITTYRRDEMVKATINRLKSWLSTYEYADHIFVRVVDNGNTLERVDDGSIVVLHNPNLGGAGGFARGLSEAEDDGATHCIFMDDDASFHMENIERSFAFLACAHNETTALAGAMISSFRPWEMWENGARFDEVSRALHPRTDLLDPDAVFGMERPSSKTTAISEDYPTAYGAWWFFAFPVKAVKYYPFPFFVRGDDISFCLENRFRIYTLNGVVSFQEDFGEKESALTLYLDLRHSLVHHLVNETLNRSALRTAKIALRFIARALFRFHYRSARVMLLSWRDVMQGPAFFDENIDMKERRAKISTMIANETWQDRPKNAPFTERRRLTLLSKRIRRIIGITTLNGHLLPFSALTWDHVSLPVDKRTSAPAALGASRLMFVNPAGDKSYEVRQSKWQFLVISLQTILTLLHFLWVFKPLRASYKKGYASLTSREYWDRRNAKNQIKNP
ncbi:MAG: glycosyltransferase [Arenibacterium sp.]